MKRETSPMSSLPVNGLMLWEVYFKSSYYDSDPRMPGTVPVDERFFVLAGSPSEALKKMKPELDGLKKKYKGEGSKVLVNFVVLEDLIPTRNSKDDGRMGWFSTTNFKEVNLSLEEDKKRFRLGVCLIPIED